MAYEFVEDFMYWKQPDKSIILVKEALKIPLAILFILFYVNLRYLLIIGLWIGTLSNSQFFVTLLTIVSHKVLIHI